MRELRFDVDLSWTGGRWGVLRRAGLPAGEMRVAAQGTVTGYPEQARFARLRVSPTVAGGDPARADEYERAAEAAHPGPWRMRQAYRGGLGYFLPAWQLAARRPHPELPALLRGAAAVLGLLPART